MELKGSCHCQKVKFTVISNAPYPFLICHCSICRKLSGGNSGGCNILADYRTLKIESGTECLKEYTAKKVDEGRPANVRSFCSECGTYVWNYNELETPDNLYPFASCIDTELPTPPYKIHILEDSSPKCFLATNEKDVHCQKFPENWKSLKDWHKDNGIYVENKK
eukprot:gene1869-1010_t